MNRPSSTLKTFWVSIILVFGYCNINAQMFIAGDTLNPEITYVNIPDTILPIVIKGFFNFDIDIDSDNINDIRFHREHSSSPSYSSETFSVQSLNSVQFVTQPGSSDAEPLLLGTEIDNALHWNDNYDGACFYYYFDSHIPPPWGPSSTSHGTCTLPDTYIGFRKIYASDTLYGWFFLDLPDPYRIKSYAIDKKLGSGIPNQASTTNTFIIFPNPASDFIDIMNNNKDFNTFHLSIINSTGQIVLKTNIELVDKCSFDLRNYTDGLYIIILQNENLKFSSKFVIRKL
ncbi:MAG: T9SS type A sorting domain-containing protein [Bacteroidales bacterium]|nr:T9SS type A sorting domain-containing protein [Bacteroidales bacterium]HQP04326.1 T9SS type A sorting domain-containing protein [Bacteroidales bacterium]